MLSWVVVLGWFGFGRDVLVYGLWMVGCWFLGWLRILLGWWFDWWLVWLWLVGLRFGGLLLLFVSDVYGLWLGCVVSPCWVVVWDFGLCWVFRWTLLLGFMVCMDFDL